METGEVIHEKVYASPRLPPKISLKHEWKRELGSEVARQPEGEVARQAEGSQPTQPNQTQIQIMMDGETHCVLTKHVPFSRNRNTFLS